MLIISAILVKSHLISVKNTEHNTTYHYTLHWKDTKWIWICHIRKIPFQHNSHKCVTWKLEEQVINGNPKIHVARVGQWMLLLETDVCKHMNSLHKTTVIQREMQYLYACITSCRRKGSKASLSFVQYTTILQCLYHSWKSPLWGCP